MPLTHDPALAGLAAALISEADGNHDALWDICGPTDEDSGHRIAQALEEAIIATLGPDPLHLTAWINKSGSHAGTVPDEILGIAHAGRRIHVVILDIDRIGQVVALADLDTNAYGTA